MRPLLLLSLLLIGCQSDADRLADLRYRETMYDLELDRIERVVSEAQERWDQTDYPVDSLTVWVDSVMPRYGIVRDSLDLVRRDIARLLQ